MKRHFLVLPVVAVFLAFGCGGGDSPITVDGLDTDSKFTGDSKTNDLKEPADDTKEDRQQADDDGTVADDDGTVADDDGTVADDDGTVADDDGTVADDDGTVADDDGTVADDDGTAADDDGTVADDDGTELQECEIDADCEGEPQQCHKFTCEEGECAEVPVANDTPCSDGDLCTVGDTCQDGECVSGSAKECDDNNPCTEDSCLPTEGCVNDPIDTEETITCGLGECFREVLKCTDGVENTCTPGEPELEECDGLDNDCDGETDEGNPGGGEGCNTGKFGVCAAGVRTCIGGELICKQQVESSKESCDGLDNDCDGETDEEISWVGEPCIINDLQGVCTEGELRCTEGKEKCTQVVFPGDYDETCDGLDNDCDGEIDEEISWLGEECIIDDLQGVCAVGERRCTKGEEECTQIVFPAKVEICDGLDNDCDGEIDNDIPGVGSHCRITGLKGVCADGLLACEDAELFCKQVNEPSAEICDGLDNNCDGETDPPGSIGCTIQYRDADGDGYGDPSDSICVCDPTPVDGYVLNRDDCCDEDANAYPGATDWFTTANGCGSFDYNCSEALELQFPDKGACTPVEDPPNSCALTEGWSGGLGQQCGFTGTYIVECQLIGTVCLPSYRNRTQGCH